MAGYSSTFTELTGDTIDVTDFSTEFNAIEAAFVESTGHKHDGTADEGPVIGLIGDAGETAPNNKIVIDTGNNRIGFFVEVTATPVEQLRILDGAILPVTDNDIDLGSGTFGFKDGYLKGTLDVGGNATVGGTLDVTGLLTLSDNVTIAGTLGVTGATTVSSLSASSDISVAADSTFLYFGAANDVSMSWGGANFSIKHTVSNGQTRFVNIAGATKAYIDHSNGNIDSTGSLSVTSNGTFGGTLDVTGNTTLSNASLSGTLGVTGATTLTTLTTSGAVTLGSTLGVTGNTSLSNVSASGTLGVTGTSTLGVLNASGAVALGSTLSVTGNSTLGVVSMSSGSSVTGAFSVSGTTTLANVNSNGNISITADNSAVRFGAGTDVSLYWDATDFNIKHAVTNGKTNFVNVAGTATSYISHSTGYMYLGGGLATPGILSITSDNTSLRIGAGDDVKQYWDGTNFIVQHAVTDGLTRFVSTTGTTAFQVNHGSGDCYVENDIFVNHDIYLAGNNQILRFGASSESRTWWNGSLLVNQLSTGSSLWQTSGGTPLLEADTTGYVWARHVYPFTSGAFDLGSATYKWRTIYATNGTIQTSDIRSKENIKELDNRFASELINSLNPVEYVLKEDSSQKIHSGFIAQEVESSLIEILGEDADKSAYFHYDRDSDTYGLNYAEFISPLVKVVQSLQERLKSLEAIVMEKL